MRACFYRFEGGQYDGQTVVPSQGTVWPPPEHLIVRKDPLGLMIRSLEAGEIVELLDDTYALYEVDPERTSKMTEEEVLGDVCPRRNVCASTFRSGEDMTTTHPDVQREAEKRAALAGIPAALIVPFIEADVLKRPIKVEYENLGWGPLMNVRWMDTQRTLVINLEHPWVQHMMYGKETSPQTRSQLEVVLFVLAEADTNDEEKRRFLDIEMYQWGTKLWTAAEMLFEPDPKTGLNMFGEDPYADEEDEDDDGD